MFQSQSSREFNYIYNWVHYVSLFLDCSGCCVIPRPEVSFYIWLHGSCPAMQDISMSIRRHVNTSSHSLWQLSSSRAYGGGLFGVHSAADSPRTRTAIVPSHLPSVAVLPATCNRNAVHLSSWLSEWFHTQCMS